MISQLKIIWKINYGNYFLQISCDLNPQPVSSGQGFDYSAIKRNIGDHLGVPENSGNNRRKVSVADTAEDISRETRRMSRSNSVVDRSYGRSTVRNERTV